MDKAIAVRKLYRLRQEWLHAGEGEEVKWTLRGIDIALQAIREIAIQEHWRERKLYPHVPAFLTTHLYNAVRRSIVLLKAGNGRERAIDVLMRAQILVEGGSHDK